MIELQEYIDLDGRNAFSRWYQSLESNTRSRVVTALDRLRHGGLAMNSVGGGVLELRLHFGPGYRVYFGKDSETLVMLLCGGSKKRQHADIEIAKGFGMSTNREAMPFTRSFDETVKEDLQKSKSFRKALLREAVGCLVSGDVETGKSVLR